MATGDLFRSGFGRTLSTRAKCFIFILFFPQTHHYFQNSLLSMLLRLPFSNVELMV